MKAYAILDGGGVKGAALVGALAAAAQHHVEWLGFGGTSAGAIVATLMAAGYSPAELKAIVVERPFSDLLDDDNGSNLKGFQNAIEEVSNAVAGWKFVRVLTTARALHRHRKLISALNNDLGIYSGDKLREWLLKKLQAKFPRLENATDITFGELRELRNVPLKIVASNVTHKAAVVYPDDTGPTASVLDAVRASVCYPFVFRPVRADPKRYLDGGLCSNLPAFLFEEDARKYRVFVLAIDLVPKADNVLTPPPGARQLVLDMLDTILEGSDKLLRDRLQTLRHVPIHIDPPISAMKFDVTLDERRGLYRNGFADFHSFYVTELAPLEAASGAVERLQALYASPDLVVPILEMLTRVIRPEDNSARVRAHVMLPTLTNSRIVTYQFGMDGSPDRTLELPLTAGCSGAAYEQKKPVYADLDDAKTRFKEWGLTQEHQERIDPRLRAMISVPLLDTSGVSASQKDVDLSQLPVVGTLSIDTTASGVEAGWVEEESGAVTINGDLVRFLQQWADIIAKLLT
jgi:NTE family protein